ncbi:MAG: HIT family protein, partial [Elusimicrobiota bacterium]
QLLEEDIAIDGFNIGVNIGRSAGQTVNHCHIHLIPRRSGDIKDPTGGVRGVIPENRIYD